MKSALKGYFLSVMRAHFISEYKCRAHYLTSKGFENWREINLDLKKLEVLFKGKIMGNYVSLIAALDD